MFIPAALFVCVFMVDLTSASERSLVYHEYAREGEDEAAVSKTSVQHKGLPRGQMSISRQKQGEACMTKDEFVLDKDLSSQSWRRVCVAEDTDILSVREGDILVVKGKLKGESIDKEIELGGQQLHIYPKYSLSKFALSGMHKMKFWTLRRDELSKLPMQAINKGTTTVMVNGQEEEVVRIYYSITGKLRKKYYNRNYYYRTSDGLFLRKEGPKGKFEELVKEE